MGDIIRNVEGVLSVLWIGGTTTTVEDVHYWRVIPSFLWRDAISTAQECSVLWRIFIFSTAEIYHQHYYLHSTEDIQRIHNTTHSVLISIISNGTSYTICLFFILTKVPHATYDYS